MFEIFFILIEIFGNWTIFQYFDTSINSIETLKFSRQFGFKGKIMAKLLWRKHFFSIYINKTTLTMGIFKKYVTWIMILFIPFTYVTLCKLYFITSPVLLKIPNYGIRKMKIFCIYGCLSISHYIKEGRKLHKVALQSHF